MNTVSTDRTPNAEVFDTVLDLDFDYAVVVCGVFTALGRLVLRMDGTHGLSSLNQSDELCSISGNPGVAILTLESCAPFKRISANIQIQCRDVDRAVVGDIWLIVTLSTSECGCEECCRW